MLAMFSLFVVLRLLRASHFMIDKQRKECCFFYLYFFFNITTQHKKIQYSKEKRKTRTTKTTLHLHIATKTKEKINNYKVTFNIHLLH